MTQFVSPNIVKDGTPAKRALPLRVGEGLSTFDFGLSTPFDGTPAHRARTHSGRVDLASCILDRAGGWVGWVLHSGHPKEVPCCGVTYRL